MYATARAQMARVPERLRGIGMRVASDRTYLGWAVGALLVILTLTLVSLALRPTAAPASPVPPPRTGAIATTPDGGAWWWSGPAACTPDANVVALQRMTDQGWQGKPIPLVNVSHLSFANRVDGIALGTDAQCQDALALTRNGGVTWSILRSAPAFRDAALVRSNGILTLWTVPQGLGDLGYQRYVVRGNSLVADNGGQPTIAALLLARHAIRAAGSPALTAQDLRGYPCTAASGRPSLIAPFSPEHVLLLCQDASPTGRLLTATTAGGRHGAWSVVADNSRQHGLDGEGTIERLAARSGSRAWALFHSAGCPEGQLRVSLDQGRTFRPLPCPARSVPVNTVLDVAFSSAENGLLLGLSNDQPVILTTSDGGRTWATSAEPIVGLS